MIAAAAGAGPPLAWLVLGLTVAVGLVVDLFVFQPRAASVGLRVAAGSAIGWVAAGLGFTLVIWAFAGGETAAAYLVGYAVEKGLALDNALLIGLALSSFAVPAALRPRLLAWAVFGALLFRVGFVALGAIVPRGSVVFTVLVAGAFGLVAVELFRHRRHHPDPQHGLLLALLRRLRIPVAPRYQGDALVVRSAGRWIVTPLLAALLALLGADLLIGAVTPLAFAASKPALLVTASTIFAVLGLRALVFLVADLVVRVDRLKAGLAGAFAVLAAGSLLGLATDVPRVGVYALALLSVGVSIAASLRSGRGPAPHPLLPAPVAPLS